MREIVSPLGGFPSPFGQRLGGGVAPFSPLSLFASGEEGVWYEPSQTTAFKSTTDLTPCEYGGPDGCGFLLDKSQGAGYSGGSFTGLGSELVDNGDFSDGFTGWTNGNDHWQIVSGAAYHPSSSAYNGLVWPVSLTAGALYFVSFDIVSIPSGTLRVLGVTDLSYTTSGTKSFQFFATGSETSITFARFFGSTLECTLDNISVRELPGNHAVQTSADARPILARVPEGGRRNLLERTEEFDDAYWTKDGSSSVSANTSDTTDPVGGNSADKYTLSGSPGVESLWASSASVASTTYTLSIYVKQNVGQWFRLALLDLGGADGVNAYFDLTNGVKGSLNTQGSGATATDHNIEDVGSGWYRVSVTGIVGTDTTIRPTLHSVTADATNTRLSNGSVYIWGAQLEEASSASAYQRVSSEYDITEAGVTSLDYLAFDGTDDFLTSGTNADWKYLHDGTGGYVGAGIIATNSANPNNSQFVFATNDADPAAVGFYVAIDDRSSVLRNNAWNVRVSNATASPTPIFEVANDTVSDIDGNLVFSLQHGSSQTPDYIFRDNSSSVYSVDYGATPSTANSQTALYIGNGGPTPTLFWSGALYGAVIVNRLLTTTEISNTETYLANRSGVTLA